MSKVATQEFIPGEVKNMDWYKKVHLKLGYVLGDTGLGYWVGLNPQGMKTYYAVVAESGIGIGTYLQEQTCKKVLSKVAKLGINWHEVSYDNYKDIISGELREKYFSIIRY